MDERAKGIGRGRGRGKGISEERTPGPATFARGRGRGRGSDGGDFLRIEVIKGVPPKKYASEVLKFAVIPDPPTPEVAKKDEPEQVYLAHGFLDPAKITIPNVSDSIRPGDERQCLLYTMNDTKNMYLHFSENFARKLDSYIEYTGKWYETMVRNIRRLDLMVSDEQLRPGAVVVVYHKENGRREWKRAKILESFDTHQGIMYKVLLLDLGEEADIFPLDIYYMHGIFVKQPLFAIKAELRFSRFYESPSYTGRYVWNYKFCEKMLTVVLNQRILVRFICKAGINDESWEVTFLSMDNPPKKFSLDRPIEQHVVVQMMGKYVD